MSEWIEFDGELTSSNNGTSSGKTSDGGSFEVSTNDTKSEDGKNYIREGCGVTIKSCPTGDCPHDKPDTLMASAGDCDRTACIGLVEICCGSGRVLRGCFGVWGC